MTVAIDRLDSEADEARFVVTYDGPDVEAGRMDAHALGGAMLALAQLIDASAALTLGANVEVNTEVAADFRRGSFSFVVVTAHAWGVANQLLGSFTMRDVLMLLGVSGGGSGLIGLLRWLRSRPIESIQSAPEGQAIITTADGDVTTVKAQTVVLLQNSTVRLHLDGVVAPLREDGITDLRLGNGDGSPPTTVRADEVEHFEPPPPQGEQLQDKTSVEIVQVVALSFLEGRKWRLKMADGTGFYSSLDDRFMKQVLSHEVEFGSGDALEVSLRTIVVRDSSGQLHADRTVERVHRRIAAPRLQLPLSLEPPAADGGSKERD